jgi:hypothetical protein
MNSSSNDFLGDAPNYSEDTLTTPSPLTTGDKVAIIVGVAVLGVLVVVGLIWGMCICRANRQADQHAAAAIRTASTTTDYLSSGVVEVVIGGTYSHPMEPSLSTAPNGPPLAVLAGIVVTSNQSRISGDGRGRLRMCPIDYSPSRAHITVPTAPVSNRNEPTDDVPTTRILRADNVDSEDKMSPYGTGEYDLQGTVTLSTTNH